MGRTRVDSVFLPESGETAAKYKWTFEAETEDKWVQLQKRSGVYEGEAKEIRRKNGQRRSELEIAKTVNEARAETWNFTMSKMKKASTEAKTERGVTLEEFVREKLTASLEHKPANMDAPAPIPAEADTRTLFWRT